MTSFSPLGLDLFGEPIKPDYSGVLSERFEFAPFSVLDARQGIWQDRKRAWIGLGIKSEIGRGGNALGLSSPINEKMSGTGKYASQGGSARPACDYSNSERGDGAGKPIRSDKARAFGQVLTKGDCPEWYASGHAGRRPHGGSLDEQPGRDPGTPYEGGDAWVASTNGSGTSIFHPVLCEMAYRWFYPPGGQIVDPFAGGSVRGIVAGLLGFHYHGIELRSEQVQANEVQRAEIAPDTGCAWVCGDSMELLEQAPAADFVFSCPPYGDLERYSDDPADLSTMEYHTFIAAYKRIILRACKVLKPNRFACFVVGDFRDPKNGAYRGFVADTIKAFQEQGLALYNDAVLVTMVGSLPIRVGKQFEAGRKLGKTHQNVLVFVKGDGRKAADQCGAPA